MAVWADSLASIYSGLITSIKLKVYGTAAFDDAFYSVLFLKDASCKLTSYTDDDIRKRPQIAYAHTLVLTFTTLAMNLVKSLADIKRVHAKVALANGNHFCTSLNDSGSLDAAMGVEWEYTNNGEIDKDQSIRFTLTLGLTNAEAIAMLNSDSETVDGSPNVADKGYPISQSVATDIKPAGIKKIELATTGGSYTDAFTTLQNTKFTAKSLADSTKDHRGRSVPIAADVEVGVECLQTGTSEAGNALVINQRVNDVKITLNSTTVVTLGANVGAKFDAINVESIDKNATIPLTATGQMPLANWTACWP